MKFDVKCRKCGEELRQYSDAYYMGCHKVSDECIEYLKKKVTELSPKPERFPAAREFVKHIADPTRTTTVPVNGLLSDVSDLLQAFYESQMIMKKDTDCDWFMDRQAWDDKWGNL